MEPYKIFPYTLLRISGGSINELDKLIFAEAPELIDQYINIQTKLDSAKNDLSEKLYAHITLLNDNPLQNTILTLRRDIFNDREISPDKIKKLSTYLPNDLFLLLNQYCTLISKKNLFYIESEELYIRKKKEMKGAVNALFSDEMFQKGLLLSSQDMLDRIPSYIADEGMQNKKRHQIEQGLFKYITRMYTKTSPFSTFTNLGIARNHQLRDTQTDFISFNNKGHEIVSHIRLNNFLFKYIKTLLIVNPDICHWFKIRPNPTISKKGDVYHLMVCFNNTDAFQRISTDSALEYIYELLKSESQGIVYGELIQKIIDADILEASYDEIDEYLKELINFGFLEYNFGVSGTDTDWDIHLREKLLPVASKNPLIDNLINVLIHVREIANKYGTEDLVNRKKLLYLAYNELREICMKLHEAAGLPEIERKSKEELQLIQAAEKLKAQKEQKVTLEALEETNEEQLQVGIQNKSITFFYFRPEGIFYEDTLLQQDIQIEPSLLKTFTEKIYQLDELLESLIIDEEHIKMTHFYIEHFKGRDEVSLLDFYETYYREFKHTERAYNKLTENNPESTVDKPEILKIKELEDSNGLKDKWNEAYVNKITVCNNHEVQLSLSDIKHAHNEVGIKDKNQDNKTSKAAFVQFFIDKESGDAPKLMGVLNLRFPGWMKLMSRFLHIFEAEVLDEAEQFNSSLQNSNLLLAEGCDASCFNANLHPPLLPYEIWMPNSNNNLPEDRQIPITDINIVEIDSKLKLVHKQTGKELHVFDLGLEMPTGRSALFQLLDKFNSNRTTSMYSLTFNVYKKLYRERKAEIKEGIVIFPRIVVAEQIVISRKKWVFPRSKVPVKNQNESEWQYFLKLNCWLREYDIPNETFIHIFHREDKPENEEQSKLFNKITRDDYKPQYINFQSPHLVMMFEKLASKVPKQMTIVEMLPNSSQLTKINNKKHIIESLIQWNDA